jgi:hypothetical protein
MTEDLWADFSPPEQLSAPASLLRDQAVMLHQKTRGLVYAQVRSTSAGDGSFWVGFDLGSPGLPEYSYRLLELTYPPEFYPLRMSAFGKAEEFADEDGFRKGLAAVLRSPRTKQVVEAIMAQARAVQPELTRT